MKATLWYVLLAIGIGAVAMVVWRYFGGLPASIVIIIPLAMIANGWLATWEDEQPGGFNNPGPRRDKPSEKEHTDEV